MLLGEPSARGGSAAIDAIEALLELGDPSEAVCRLQRAHRRFETRSLVRIQAGSRSHRQEVDFEAICRDISAGGCKVMADQSVRVGDIFLMNFDATVVGVPPVFARCVRCQYLRDDSYEMGFRFLSPVTLPGMR